MSTLKIDGLAQLNKLLKELPAKIETNIMRGALREGSKQFLERARDEVPVKSGKLRKSLRISTRSKKGQVTASLSAGGKGAFYAYMVEFGTASHLIKPKTKKSLMINGASVASVDHPGSEDKPFMRKAFDAGSADAVKAATDYIKKRLEKEAAKK
jgi:HK97 gp10 family phage protein